MPACERCGLDVVRRRRCDACGRLCCTECLDFPGSGYGRDGIVWCARRPSRRVLDDCTLHSNRLSTE